MYINTITKYVFTDLSEHCRGLCCSVKPLTDVASKCPFLLVVCSLQGVASISKATATCGITSTCNDPLVTVPLQ